MSLGVSPQGSTGGDPDGGSRRPLPPAKKKLSATERFVPALISITMVLLVFGIVAVTVTSAEQWPRIARQFFDLGAMAASFPQVLRGFWLNIQIWVICLFGIMALGLVLALFRALSGPWFAPLRVFTVVYIDIFRGLPVLLLVLIFGFGIPALNLPGLPNSALFWGATAMVISYAAYSAEIYRSGIEAVHDGQWAAAKALGLGQWQTMRYAILPQAVRNVIPVLLNLAVALQKDVALLSVIGVRDAVREAQIYTAQTFNYSSLIAAALLFLLATIPMARLTDYIARKDRQRRLQGVL
ncbi:amino acid ABC transporter permease [Pelagibacterium sp. 26DY04]|uniref:amino acid ABC transporter permease n=1 Tax=Pelagibacterium sp. 26DY04 TaxID=2967130 RepID=UPI0028154DAA|nr:amino acid ABC transporter permease [Pelagibacterium sp. 26DY04]WMT86434.1 amino acid ABC transporter permease [Pelagibacterium sp. 26DY04]